MVPLSSLLLRSSVGALFGLNLGHCLWPSALFLYESKKNFNDWCYSVWKHFPEVTVWCILLLSREISFPPVDLWLFINIFGDADFLIASWSAFICHLIVRLMENSWCNQDELGLGENCINAEWHWAYVVYVIFSVLGLWGVLFFLWARVVISLKWKAVRS